MSDASASTLTRRKAILYDQRGPRTFRVLGISVCPLRRFDDPLALHLHVAFVPQGLLQPINDADKLSPGPFRTRHARSWMCVVAEE